MPEYALMSLNIIKHDWILLNVPEYAWINYSNYARVLNMLRYSYNNIIIVTNVIILEFLSALNLYTQAICYPFIFL